MKSLLSIFLLTTLAECARIHCGESAVKENRIINGKVAKKGAQPWIVSLRRRKDGGNYTHHCGGTIIDKNWILTAAHCFRASRKRHDPEKWEVVAGEYIKGIDECSEQKLDVLKIIDHEKFNDSAGDHHHDIALVKLNGQFQLGGKYVRKACYQDDSVDFDGDSECVIAGWGTNRKEGIDRETLLYYNSTILTREECQENADAAARLFRGKIEPIQKEMTCIETSYDKTKPRGSKSSGGVCNGDSGGPLICRKNGYYYLAGITAFAFHVFCGRFDDVFTKLSHYGHWIRKTKRKFRHPVIKTKPVRFEHGTCV